MHEIRERIELIKPGESWFGQGTMQDIVNRVYANYDANSDGVIDLVESFDQGDAMGYRNAWDNRDGALTKAEFTRGLMNELAFKGHWSDKGWDDTIRYSSSASSLREALASMMTPPRKR